MLTMSWFGFYIFALPDLLNIPLGFEVWILASPIATFKQLFIAYTYFALQFRPFIIETLSYSISKVPEEEQNEE